MADNIPRPAAYVEGFGIPCRLSARLCIVTVPQAVLTSSLNGPRARDEPGGMGIADLSQTLLAGKPLQIVDAMYEDGCSYPCGELTEMIAHFGVSI